MNQQQQNNNELDNRNRGETDNQSPGYETGEKFPIFMVVARYGDLKYVDIFESKFGDVRRGDKVVLRTGRGTELGEALTGARSRPQGERIEFSGRLIRRATSDDFRLKREIEEIKVANEKEFCEKKIRELDLPMKLATVEHLFGGEKIIFYFLAEGRVDFRQLVKELAKEYRTRIEMKQIGVRDEAKLVSDYEHCGRELCCRSFMKTLEPVTMKMAKNQKATLDPSKISGACGRLMCCLRFEDDIYNEFKKILPRRGSTIDLHGRSAEVLDYDIIQLKIKLLVEGRDLETVTLRELNDPDYMKKREQKNLVGGLWGEGTLSEDDSIKEDSSKSGRDRNRKSGRKQSEEKSGGRKNKRGRRRRRGGRKKREDKKDNRKND